MRVCLFTVALGSFIESFLPLLRTRRGDGFFHVDELMRARVPDFVHVKLRLLRAAVSTTHYKYTVFGNVPATKQHRQP
jgi:hypothetical protein